MSGFTVTRVRRTPVGHDKYGDSTATGETREPITGCAIAPRSEQQADDRGRHGVIVGLTLYAPLGTDLVSTDLIQIDPDDDHDLYEIEGEVGEWNNPFEPGHGGVEADLKRATG